MEVREETIDGMKVEVIPLPFFKALKLKRELLNIVTPSLKKLLSEQDTEELLSKNISEANVDIRAIGEALTDLIGSLNEATYMSLIESLFSSVRIDDDDIGSDTNKINNHFTGRFMTFYKVCWFILRSNFSDFLEREGFGNAIREMKNTTPKPEK